MKIKLLIVIFALTTLVSCGDESKNTVEAQIIIKNHRFEPEILTLPAGYKIRLIIENQDDTMEEFESLDLKREKIIFGHSKANIILAPLQPGEYKFFGEFNEDTARGKIIVTEKEKTDD